MATLARTAILGIVGAAALAGFSVAAYSTLGKLAGPQTARATISHRAADWPDLKDGVPALASRADSPAVMRTEPVAAMPSNAARPEPVTSATPARRNPPPIEVASVVEATRPTPLVAVARMADLVKPRASETVRARAVETALAALPPESAAKPVRKSAAAAAAAGRAKPASASDAAPVAEAAPAETDETEVLGVKVPSLAASGRRLVEGVQSLGDAVAKQF